MATPDPVLLDFKSIVTWLLNLGGFGTVIWLGREKLRSLDNKIDKYVNGHHKCREEVTQRLSVLETSRQKLKGE